MENDDDVVLVRRVAGIEARVRVERVVGVDKPRREAGVTADAADSELVMENDDDVVLLSRVAGIEVEVGVDGVVGVDKPRREVGVRADAASDIDGWREGSGLNGVSSLGSEDTVADDKNFSDVGVPTYLSSIDGVNCVGAGDNEYEGVEVGGTGKGRQRSWFVTTDDLGECEDRGESGDVETDGGRGISSGSNSDWTEGELIVGISEGLISYASDRVGVLSCDSEGISGRSSCTVV